MYQITAFVIFWLTFMKTQGELVSPCPDYFSYLPNKTRDDKWYGIITISTNENVIRGVTLDLEFDKSIIYLGSKLSPFTSDTKNINFRISDAKKEVTPTQPLKVEIYVLYDPFLDTVAPRLVRIKLNGREICPNTEYVAKRKNTSPKKCGTPVITTTNAVPNHEYTVRGQWPWRAALYKRKGTSRTYLCEGILISEQHVLTVAHCAYKPEDIIVILGKHELLVDVEDEQTFNLSKISVHEGYNKTDYKNDIAILHLNQPYKYTDYVRHICLGGSKTNETIVDRFGTIVSWRNVDEFPMQGRMLVATNIACIYSFPDFYSRFLSSHKLCAGYKRGTTECIGRSGSGLIFQKEGTSGLDSVWELRGMATMSVATKDGRCDPTHYVIFTDVATYSDWIEEKIKS